MENKVVDLVWRASRKVFVTHLICKHHINNFPPGVCVSASCQPHLRGRARAAHSTADQEGDKMGSRSTEEPPT